ncbi:MAG: sugar kinase [Timaviella obliquedivisa GSE-PSE-MK23-08B]|jgi:sugar/nucleoside kinase (ribokinase family)|nr:sugar kinase [Timaviella obliquedivisa GSE-PSE-MK23-08B]
MSKQGLFVGLVTLDLIYLVTELPQCNQKIVALEDLMTAGGPATNAAVTFSHLGNSATLLGSVGQHPSRHLMLADLQGVAIADLTPNRTQSLPVSSILVTQSTGERAIVSRNAVQAQAPVTAIPSDILREVEIVLIDGHQMAVGQVIAEQSNAQKIPIVVDGGSWKAGFEKVLPYVDYAICSANFRPPQCTTLAEALDYLIALKIPHITITNGSQPIQYFYQGIKGQIAVPQVQPVDTLGAGDIFHGAFCHFILSTHFLDALTQAAAVAGRSCQSFGTRQWMSR